ncbi:MAG: DHHA1 domain-containing protein [Nitrososphaerales archaeon]
MHSNLAHTAEHIFMGSLQQLVDGISVRKVEHRDTINKVYLKSSELTLDIIYQAEVTTNKVIEEGREVKEHMFPSIEEARKRFPHMRAYEERIFGEVRVIEIDSYDYSACAREHAQKTSDCKFFLITRVSKEGDQYEVEFLAGKEAQESALDLSMKCIKVARELGASMQTLEATAKNMKNELDTYRKRMIILTETFIDSLTPVNRNDKIIYAKIIEALDDSVVMKKAGEIIQQNNTIVLLVNINSRATVLLACNENLQVNCNAILKSVLAKFGGKGGGKLNFATGSVEREKSRETFITLRKELNLE